MLAVDRNPLYVYCGTKTLAEQAAWKLAEEHPDLDLATSASSLSLKFPLSASPLTPSRPQSIPRSYTAPP